MSELSVPRLEPGAARAACRAERAVTPSPGLRVAARRQPCRASLRVSEVPVTLHVGFALHLVPVPASNDCPFAMHSESWAALQQFIALPLFCTLPQLEAKTAADSNGE
jgi:hypothetical protein